LFSLYSIQPLPGLLALASGYIFSGLFAFLQTLAFPGAYSPSGLIGDQLSSAPYLFFLWHIAFPLAVTVYALSDDRARANDLPGRSTKATIAITIACTLVLTAGLTWAVTAGARYLPSLFVDQMRQAPITSYIAAAIWILSAAALVLLYFRKRTSLAVWLMVTLFATLPDLTLTTVLTSVRFTLGWYTARSYAPDRQLYGSDRTACTNRLALCPPCPNHSLATTRTRQSPYELGRRHGRNRS
jgi:hypothetical protein